MTREPTNAAPRSGLKIPNSLLALGSAAVVAIYSAGSLRTEAAAHRFDEESGARRRPVSPTASDPERMPPAAAAADSVVADSVGTGPVGAANQVVSNPAVSTPVVSTAVESTPVASKPVASTPVASKPVVSKPSVAGPAASASASIPGASGTSAEAPATQSAPASVPTSAPASPQAPPVPVDSSKVASGDTAATAAAAPKAMWRDGTFSGWGSSRHGDIEATVVIEGGRITGASISRCLTRYSCSWIAHLQQQVVTRQSPDVDYVSGATQSANAFYYAVFDALQKAK